MKRIRSVSVSLTLVACVGMVIPQATIAEVAAAKRQAPRSLDVALQDGGLLIGQVVNPQGAAKEGVEVSVRERGRELVRATTDKQGRFAVKGLNSGLYELATASGNIPVRAWSKSTAPPNVAIGALMVDGTTVRGQCNCNRGQNGHSAGQVSGGYVDSGAYGGASFNQGGASFNQGGTAYTGGTVVQGDAGVAYDADSNGANYHNDPGANYVDGSSELYDSSGAACPDGGGVYGGGYGGHGVGHGHGGAFGGGGRWGGGGFGWLASPWVIGTGVAAAIAIPIALDDDDAS